MTVASATRALRVRRGLWLNHATIAYNSIEGFRLTHCGTAVAEGCVGQLRRRQLDRSRSERGRQPNGGCDRIPWRRWPWCLPLGEKGSKRFEAQIVATIVPDEGASYEWFDRVRKRAERTMADSLGNRILRHGLQWASFRTSQCDSGSGGLARGPHRFVVLDRQCAGLGAYERRGSHYFRVAHRAGRSIALSRSS